MKNELTCFQRTVFSLLSLISALFCQTPEAHAEAEPRADNAMAVWDANGAPNPLAFSFVVHENGIPFLLLSRAGGNFDSSATPELLGEFGRAFRALSDPREQLDWSTWQDRPVVLFGTTTRCNATVRTIGQLVRFTGGWDDLVMTGAAPADRDAVNDTRLAELTFLSSISETYVAAKLEPDPGQDCSGTVWGRAGELPLPNVTIAIVADSKTARSLERSLRRSDEWAETQKEFNESILKSRRFMHNRPPSRRWENYYPQFGGPRFRILGPNTGISVAWANVSASSDECGEDFVGTVTRFWTRAHDSKHWTPIIEPADRSRNEPLFAMNLDEDVVPQIFFREFDEVELMRWKDGKFRTALSYQINYHGCPC